MHVPRDLGWTELSDEEREREYSPSSCVPNGDLQPFITAYQELSDAGWAKASGRADVRTRRLEHGPSESHGIDLAVPTEPTSPPLLVFIHGGYWQQLSSRDSCFPVAACADRGWAFAAIDYPLAPEARLDEIVASCCDAVAMLQGEATQLGFDPDRIIVAGHSAGAHLTAMVALDDRVRLAGTVLVSGVFELEPLIGTTINEALELDVQAAIRHSPLRKTVRSFPRTLLAYGSVETDQFKLQTAAFTDHLEDAGTLTEQFEIPGKNHFDVILDLAEPQTSLGDAVESLVALTVPRPDQEPESDR